MTRADELVLAERFRRWSAYYTKIGVSLRAQGKEEWQEQALRGVLLNSLNLDIQAGDVIGRALKEEMLKYLMESKNEPPQVELDDGGLIKKMQK
jgi:hypothetical protein